MAKSAQELLDEKKAQVQANAANQSTSGTLVSKEKTPEELVADEKLAASKKDQEEQEKKAEYEARLTAARALLAENGETYSTEPQSVVIDSAAAAGVPQEAFTLGAPFRTFKHLYAGANTILSSGKKLVFGGPIGGVGYYTTNKAKELEHLIELSETPGSMVTEVLQDKDGRYLVQDDPILRAEQMAVQRDSRANTATDLNPNVSASRNNLARTIAAE